MLFLIIVQKHNRRNTGIRSTVISLAGSVAPTTAHHAAFVVNFVAADEDVSAGCDVATTTTVTTTPMTTTTTSPAATCNHYYFHD